MAINLVIKYDIDQPFNVLHSRNLSLSKILNPGKQHEMERGGAKYIKDCFDLFNLEKKVYFFQLLSLNESITRTQSFQYLRDFSTFKDLIGLYRPIQDNTGL